MGISIALLKIKRSLFFAIAMAFSLTIFSQNKAKELIELDNEVYSEFLDSTFKLCIESEKLNDETAYVGICGCKEKYTLFF